MPLFSPAIPPQTSPLINEFNSDESMVMLGRFTVPVKNEFMPLTQWSIVPLFIVAIPPALFEETLKSQSSTNKFFTHPFSPIISNNPPLS